MLGDKCFEGCGTLSEIHISNVEGWCKVAFPNIESTPLYNGAKLYLDGEEITNIIIPSGITEVPSFAFYNCTNLESVIFQNGLEVISDKAFYGCSKLTKIDFPSTLTTIGTNVFQNCSLLSNIDFPQSINSLGNYAFQGCSNLTKIVAHWESPFSLDGNTFSGVSPDCYLYVPIGTATKYITAGWNVPNVKAAGILNVTANEGGKVNCYNTVISNTSENILFTPYRTFDIALIPNEGYDVKKVLLNGYDVLPRVQNGILTIEEPEENMSLSVIFADASIQQGDVNGDKIINEDDARLVVNYLLKYKPEMFHDYWADVNGDGEIDVTDAILILKNHLDNNQ